MKIIVGLGNPGKEYEDTRHNIGFVVIDYLAKKYGGPAERGKSHTKRDSNFEFDKKFEAELSEVKINGKKVLLVKPQVFVNNSGRAIKKIATSYKLQVPIGKANRVPTSSRILDEIGRSSISQSDIGTNKLIIVHDDLDISFGKVKVSFGRSSAGHLGVDSIIKTLKTDKFYRVRIGTLNKELEKIKKIKNKRKKISEINKFVVSGFKRNEKAQLGKIIKEAVSKIESIL